MEPDFLQDCTDLNHLDCNIGKCQAGSSDTLDMNDFEPMIHTPSTEEKEKIQKTLESDNPVQAKEIKTLKSNPTFYLHCVFSLLFLLCLLAKREGHFFVVCY